MPVTGVARTLIDLAGAVRESAAEYAIHQAQVKGLLDRPQLLDELAHAPNRAGTAAVRRILSLSPVAEDAVKSSLERRMLRLCKRAGLPAPEANRWIALDGGGLEVDLCWPAHGLIVEVDSARFHDDERAARNDPNRDRRLVLAGVAGGAGPRARSRRAARRGDPPNPRAPAQPAAPDRSRCAEAGHLASIGRRNDPEPAHGPAGARPRIR